MDLGQFSVSLAVKDLQASKQFYAKLGFEVLPGEDHGDNPYDKNWVILSNGKEVIGLFQGMFEKNMLTFNPGWGSEESPCEDFTDVRELQRELKARGVELLEEADEQASGPASFMAVDPDGNPILVDQHV